MKTKQVQELKCSRCGKDLVYEHTGKAWPAMSISIAAGVQKTSPAFVDRQLGVYAGERDWHLCFECMLKVLGIVPKREET